MPTKIDNYFSGSSGGSSQSDAEFFAALSGPSVAPQQTPIEVAQALRERIAQDKPESTDFLAPNADIQRGREIRQNLQDGLVRGVSNQLADDLLGPARDEATETAAELYDLLGGDAAKEIGERVGGTIEKALRPVRDGIAVANDLRDRFEESTGIPANLSPIGQAINLVDNLRGEGEGALQESIQEINETSGELAALVRDRIEERRNRSRPCPYDSRLASDGSRCGGRSAESRGRTRGYDTPRGFFDNFPT